VHFPVFLDLRSREVLVVGGGRVAFGKVASLLEAGALVTVVAPRIDKSVNGAELVVREFQPADLDGKWLVVAAATADVNRAVAAEAGRRRIFVNAVDDAASASAYLGGVVRKGGVTLAVGTDGRAPALSGLLREALAAVLPDDLEQWTRTASQARALWRAARVPMAERRPLLLEALNELYLRRRSA